MRYFPVREKAPLTAHWKEDAKPFQELLPYEQEGDIGLVTGGGFFVLDADNKNGGLNNLAKLGLPPTYTVSTINGGKHLYFLLPPGRTMPNRQGFLPGLDIRGDGGYVVCPPSQGYEVEKDIDVAHAPEALLALLERPERAQTGEWQPPSAKGKLNARTLAFIAFGALPGMWHQELVQATFNCKQEGYNEEEAIALLEKATGTLDTAHDLKQIADIYKNRTPLFEGSAPAIVWASDLVAGLYDALADVGKSEGLPTGIGGLDELFGGGKRLGELTVLVAEAKTGKNTLWHKLMHLWLTKGEAVGYASQELSPLREVLPNLATLDLGKDVYKFPELLKKWAPKWKLAFTPSLGPFPEESLLPWMDACISAGVSYFFIDHYHFLLSNPEDYQEGSSFIRNLKLFAREKNIHIDLIVQPKILGQGEQLSLNSARGGAAIAQALDNLVLMDRVKDEAGKRTNVVRVKLEVGRHKWSKLGQLFLQYDSSTMNFVEVVPEETAPVVAQFYDTSIPSPTQGKQLS